MSDPYAYNNRLLLHLTGAHNSTTFIDSSVNPKTVSANNGAKISTAFSLYGQGSAVFDGSNQYLSIPNHAEFDLAGDFTLEGFFYIPSALTALYGSIISNSHSSWFTGATAINIGPDLKPRWSAYNFSSTLAASTAIPLSTWVHFAAVRSGSSCSLYIDGVLIGSRTWSGTVSLGGGGGVVRIGGNSWDGANGYFKGHLQDIRVTGGIARYTAPFTPPTAPLPDFVPVGARLLGLAYAYITDGGAYQITGTVTELGTAGRYRVRLFDRRTARCIRETWSAVDGTYSFPYIAYRLSGYFVVAYDHGGSPLNAAIADLVTPEPMP